MLRVVALTQDWEHKSGVDVYTGKAVKKLTNEEIAYVGDAKYAVERYGQSNEKKIALTFDDGPDPLYTPKILDILAKEKIPATFFALGSAVTKHDEIAKRIVSEGHVLANHTFTHSDLDLISPEQAEQEITQTQRIIRAATSHNPSYFRIPYGGNDDESLRDDVRAILEAQKLGYTVSSYQFDSNDWGFTEGKKAVLPSFNGTSKVVLLHDGGGNRDDTIAYLKQLIAEVRKAGYTFTSLDGIYVDRAHLNKTVDPTLADNTSLVLSNMTLVWPKRLIGALFIFTLALLFYSMMVNVVFAALQISKPKPKRRSPKYQPLISVIIPAYNEEKVLKKSIGALLRSHYRNFEIIIVNDGSTDKTKEIIDKLAMHPKVRGIHQKNAGKPAAVNMGLNYAKGDIVASMDADTIFPRNVLGNFVRHFADPKIGAVAGTVKVGNIGNMVTRWQALEYITSINIERTAQAFINAIMIVPGACSAWRKEAIVRANGYSDATLAEDCDLTLMMHKLGYKVIQDLDAEAYTEAPMTLKNLAKQRFRWIFGNIQAFWKHRDMIFSRHYGWLGLFVIPRAIISIMMQIIFAPLLLLVSLGNILSGEYMIVLVYFIISVFILLIAATIGIIFAREKYVHLLATPFYRIAYGPMRTFILYASVITAVKGLHVGWGKIARTGTVTIRMD